MRKVAIAALMALVSSVALARTELTAPAALYASPSGVNTNDCASVSTPCQLDYIVTTFRDDYDARGKQVTINLACGNYSMSGFDGRIAGVNRPDQFLITGPSSSPTCAVFTNGFVAQFGAMLKIKYARFLNAGTSAVGGGTMFWVGRVDYGAASAAGSVHLNSSTGGSMWAVDPYTVSGGASQAHWNSAGSSQTKALPPPAGETMVTFIGTPSFPGYFASAVEGGLVNFGGVTFTGAVSVNKSCGVNYGGKVYSGGTSLPTATNPPNDIAGWGFCP